MDKLEKSLKKKEAEMKNETDQKLQEEREKMKI
jgi:hypothetical protein